MLVLNVQLSDWTTVVVKSFNRGGYMNQSEWDEQYQIALVDAIAYMEEHGTHLTESVPKGAVRH